MKQFFIKYLWSGPFEQFTLIGLAEVIIHVPLYIITYPKGHVIHSLLWTIWLIVCIFAQIIKKHKISNMIRTAEFVSPMHPDKLCDRISDAIVAEHLKSDPFSRCAVETCGGYNKVCITGEITSQFQITDDRIKEIVKEIANVDDVIIHLVTQSPEIAQGVDKSGAGDQGIMVVGKKIFS